MKKRPRIALCFPNFNWQAADSSFKWDMFPFALCILASVARDICDVEIVDANFKGMTKAEFEAALIRGEYDLVGVSVLMDLFAESGHAAISIAKKALPKAITVMGGVYPTTNPEDAIKNPDLDFVCIGEGEEVFPALVRHLFDNRELPARGLAFHDGDGTVVQPRAPFVQNLDAYPRAAYDLIDFLAYANSYDRKSADRPGDSPFVFLYTSRGCPQSCTFCQASIVAGHTVRARSAKSVLDELEFLRDTYGIRSFGFSDENLLANRERAKAIFTGLIERGLVMPWVSAVAAFRLDDELMELMAKSGCTVINPAVESGVPRVLKEIIHKPVDLGHVKHIVELARKYSIFSIANFIIGFPGETWGEIRQTCRFAEELDADYTKIFAAIPLPHTKLWEMCEKADAFAPGFSATGTSWNEGQIRSPHFDSRELTLLRAYEWDRINFSTEAKCVKIAGRMRISLAELDAIRRSTRELALKRIAESRS